MTLDPARFLTAQAPTWDRARAELAAGRKESHWMWFIFPQLGGLGRSPTAKYFGLAGLSEAAEYLAHPILGARLIEASSLLLGHDDKTAEAILGPVDAAKLRSCMTLFARVPGTDPVFARVLAAFHAGRPCDRTLAAIGP